MSSKRHPEDDGHVAKATRLQKRIRGPLAVSVSDLVLSEAMVDQILKDQKLVDIASALGPGDDLVSFSDDQIDEILKMNSMELSPSPEDIAYAQNTIISKTTQASLLRLDRPPVFVRKTIGLFDPLLRPNMVPNSKTAKLNEIYTFIEHGVVRGDSSSCLVVGSRKSGKKLVLDNALAILDEKYNSNGNHTFMTIRLSGAVQTDDKQAVREIARQLDLNLKRFLEGSRFLQFYGHEGEDDSDDEDEDIQFQRSSINETFTAILSSLEQISLDAKNDANASKRAMALVFVIDDFERFTTHGRQTLLYNLFDLSSSNHTIPITIVGLTSKVNIKELMEKRVDSRFSQRIITFFGHIGGKNASDKGVLFNYHTDSEAEWFWFDVRYNLCLNYEELQDSRLKNKKFGLVWNDYINALFYHQGFGSAFKDLFLKMFITVKSPTEFLNSMLYPLSRVCPSHPFPLNDDVLKYTSVNNFNSFNFGNNILKDLLNTGLSELQLLLVICAARVTARLDINYVNFNLCYEEYLKLSKSFKQSSVNLLVVGSSKISLTAVTTARVWSKKACRETWEKLEELGLMVQLNKALAANAAMKASGGSSSASDHYDTRFFQTEVNIKDLHALVDSGHAFKKFIRV